MAIRGFGKTGWRATLVGELLAEFLGTFVLIAFGDGVVAMAVAALPGSGRTANPTTIFNAAGDWLLITWGWAFAVTFGIYVAGGITGAHINPAVTLGFAVNGTFPWKKVIPYWIAQVVGAFAGAALVLANYYKAINAFNAAIGATRASPKGLTTFSIFATFPAPYFGSNMAFPFLDQVIGTGFLVLLILAIVDVRNMPPIGNLSPFIVGLVVAAIGMSYGANAGYAINPARDFGPRLLAYATGWGGNAFSGPHGYWWVPIAGPLVGGIIAIPIYRFFIRDILIARAAGEEPGVVERGRTVEDRPVAGDDEGPSGRTVGD